MTEIKLANPFNRLPLQKVTEGLIDNIGNLFPYREGAYRFVKENNYTENFGFQWNKFVTAQVDKSTNMQLSRQRFFAETGWNKEDLTAQNVLEVGSGAGRFSQIVLDHTKANLYSVDYSNAVEANFKNNGPSNRLHLFQASVYDMPFEKGQFDKAICIGVLQHTPDVEKSVKCIIDMVKPGGEVVVDFYEKKGWWTKLSAKYLLRFYTKRLSNEKLYKIIDKNIDWMIKANRFFSKIGVGKTVNRFIPLCDIDGTLPKDLPYAQLRELCVLDTFDMFSPQYDRPQKISTVINWFNKYGMQQVWGGNVVYDHYTASVVKGIKK